MEVRLVRPQELQEVGRLTSEAYISDGFIDPADRYVAELADAARRAREAEVWVAVESVAMDGPGGTTAGSAVNGSVTFCPLGSPYREIAHDDEGEFRMLAVSALARGRGVGRALVEVCVERSRELGYSGVRMSSMDRMASAHRVYERLGFTRVPEDDWSPVPGVTLLAYTLSLTR